MFCAFKYLVVNITDTGQECVLVKLIDPVMGEFCKNKIFQIQLVKTALSSLQLSPGILRYCCLAWSGTLGITLKGSYNHLLQSVYAAAIITVHN